MGGHAILRSDLIYRRVVYLGKPFTEKGRLIVTGGGPGAMEAAHLVHGWPAANWEVEDAIIWWSKHLLVETAIGLRQHLRCLRSIHRHTRSLGVPPGFMVTSPPASSTHIAKYFANSIRRRYHHHCTRWDHLYTGSAVT